MHEDRLRSLLRTIDESEQPRPEFADALFERLSIQAAGRGRSRGILVLLVAALLAVALASGIAIGSGMIDLPGPSELPSPVAVASGSPSVSQTPSATVVSPRPSTPPAIAPNGLVVTRADSLRYRAEPGTSGAVLGSLALGTTGLVLDGPREADGLTWYWLASVACAETPIDAPPCLWEGWAAASGPDGSAWLEGENLDFCPPAPTLVELTSMTQGSRLACYRSTELTFRAYFPNLPPDAGLGGACEWAPTDVGWLTCQNINYFGLTATDAPLASGIGDFTVTLDTRGGGTEPDRGQWLELTGHFDDPASAGCGPAGFNADPVLNVLNCRFQFVVTAFSVVPGP